jgi:AcrR family transcriptional regulator
VASAEQPQREHAAVIDDPKATIADRPARRRRRSGREVEEEIITAAVELFAARGFEGTTMREVAVRSGIHEPTLYRHYPSKDALFDAAILSKFDQELLAVFAGPSIPVPTEADGLLPVFEPVLDFFSRYRRIVLVVVERCMYASDTESEVVKRVISQVEALIDTTAPMIEEYVTQHTAATKEETPAVASLMLSLALGLAFLEPMLPRMSFGLSSNDLKQQMAKGPGAGLGLASRTEENTGRVQVLIERLLEASRAETRAQTELEHLARWGDACPQNRPVIPSEPEDRGAVTAG